MVTIDGVGPADDAHVIETAQAVHVVSHGRQTIVGRRELAAADLDDPNSGGVVKAPLHGKVLAVLVGRGAEVTRGQKLAIIEAMKMEHSVTAPRDGTVAELVAAAGDQVAEGARLMTIAARKEKKGDGGQ